jgi:hypothetical protein
MFDKGAGMIAKFSESVRLLWRHLGLFSAITLTVWLPGNILINYFSYNNEDGSPFFFMKLALWIDAIFGPICIGAVLFAVFQIKSGRAVSYREAMAVGIRKWGPLIAARFIAGFFILFGVLAFVVPGMYLMVRYALLDAAVVLEDKDSTQSRVRSAKLVQGRGWQIFGAGALFFTSYVVFSFVIYLPLGFFESLNLMPVEIVLDCLLDIIFVVIQIVMFLFYWESIQSPEAVEPVSEVYEVPAATIVPREDFFGSTV